MRILIVTPMPPQAQPTNAVPLVVQAQLAGLAPRHELTLLTVAGPDPDERAAVGRARAIGLDIHAIERGELYGLRRWQRRWRLVSSWLAGRYPFRTIWYWDPRVQHILDRLLAETSFDLVMVQDNAMGIYRYPTNAPTILTEMEVRRPRNIDWGVGLRASRVRWALAEADWHRWRRYQCAVWRRFDRVLVFTARDAAGIQAIAPELVERVRINPFGIELPPEADLDREEPGTIVFSGGFSHVPNVDAALWLGNEIMPLLRARYPGVRLIIVGSFPPSAVLALAGDDIVVTGRVAEVEPFLERASVILAPLRIGGGMRVKVLQGMGLGKAVVTTPLGAEGLTIGECTPPLAVATGAEEIAEQTAGLLAAADRRRELGHRARAFVTEHFSHRAYAGRLEQIAAELQEARMMSA